MAYTLGKQLAQSRAKHNLSVEDIAHRTRIPGSIVKYLENDDYSHFPNLVYAKSFLKMYSHYLDVDASEFLEELREASTARKASPFLQAQVTRAELEELSKNRINLDFIPWSKILSVLFFVGVSIPAAMFIAKLYKENKDKINESLSGKDKKVIEGAPVPGESNPAEIKPTDPAVTGDGDESTDNADEPDISSELVAVPKAVPIEESTPGESTDEESDTGSTPATTADGTSPVPDAEEGETPDTDSTTSTTGDEPPSTVNEDGSPVASTPIVED